MSAPETPPAAQLMQYITGAWVAQAVYAAAKLGVADHLKDGPKPVADLATAVGVAAEPLHRLLRALASVGVFIPTADGGYALTPAADLLRTDAPGSLRAVATMYGEPWHRAAWSAIGYSLRTGKPAFDEVHGAPIFDYIPKHPEVGAIFDAAMTGFTSMAAQSVLGAYDFTAIGTLVDVAGGHGSLLAAILKAHPQMQGVLFDMPSVIAGAPQGGHLARAGVADRCQLVGGDFFQEVPPGDACVLKHIIHDWSDAHAVRILTSCRKALRPGGRLLLMEMALPAGNEAHFGKWLDLEMLMMTQGGRERTEAEYRTLLEKAGFRLTRVVPTPSPTSVIEAAPV